MKNIYTCIMLFFWIGFLFGQKNVINRDTCFSIYDSITNRTIYKNVDKMPEFFGGIDSLMKFVNDNMNIPFKSDIEGTVFITVIIEVDGSLTNAKIIKGIGGGCDEEVCRVVKKMPKWKPGKCKEKLVPVEFCIPIKIILQ